MSKKHLKRKPQNVRGSRDQRRIDPYAWYYEEPKGLCIHDGTNQCYIPLHQIRAYLARLDRADG